MTTQEKRDFIDEFDKLNKKVNPTIASWEDTLNFAKELNLISEDEYKKLFKLAYTFRMAGDNTYILLVNLLYNKIKNHQLKG